MPERWNIGERQQSTVHFLKLIQNLRDQFPYDPLTALVVETFANSLDAKATYIDICVDSHTYKILDNGAGMDQDGFVDYHNVASLTKRRGEGIGFAGVGAKIFLDRAEYTLTETKSQTFHGSTHWAFYGESLEWEPIGVKNRVTYPSGTYVEVKLRNEEDREMLTAQFVEGVLQRHYNAVLMGYYKVKKVRINGKILEAWRVDQNNTEKRVDSRIRVGRRYIICSLVKSKKELPEDFQGPQIVVYGKTVMPWWFRQYPTCSECITGLILADYLIDILTTSKSDFDRSSMLWKYFHNRVGKFLANWLEEIGAKLKPPEMPTDLTTLSRKIEKTINDLLNMPEFAEVADRIFQNIIQRTAGIRSQQGGYTGIEVEGKQTTTGTLGGQGEGGGVDVIGDESGKGIVEGENGNIRIERIRRKIRGGIKISYDNQPENLSEGWVDPGTQTLTINTGHSAWKVAEGLTLQARAEHVRVYHMLRTVFTVLADEAGGESPKEIVTNLLSAWYRCYIGA